MTAAVLQPDRPARGIERRQLLFGGMMLAATALATVLRPRAAALALAPGALEAAIPKTIGAYRFETTSGLVLPPQDEISQRIYDQVLTRIYVADGLPAVMLLIAYGSAQDSSLALHRPEVCYPASGYKIGPVEHVSIAGIDDGRAHASRLSAEREGRIEQIYYWTRVGHEFPADQFSEKLAVARANIAGLLPDGVLVRLSVLDTDGRHARPCLESFNKALLGSLGAAGRKLLLGVAG